MAKYTVKSIEEQANGNVHCDTFVQKEDNTEIGHFTVVISAADVLSLAGLDKPDRIAGYKALFFSDPRIAKTIDSEAAVSQMSADIDFPVTVSI